MSKFLTKMQRYRLEHPEELRALNIAQRGAFFRDIKKKAKMELNDLSFLLERLPEKQLAQIFNKQSLLPFLEKIFDFKHGEDEKEDEKKRKRILQIWDQLLNKYVFNTTYALELAGREITLAIGSIHGLSAAQAIYFAATQT